MAHMNQVRVALLIAMIISLITYHFTSYLTDQFAVSLSRDLLALVKVAQIAVSIALIFLLVYSRWLIRLVLRDTYIGGHYCGRSEGDVVGKNHSTNRKRRRRYKHLEVFTIYQDLFETRIEGNSFKCRRGASRLVSTWDGRLFRTDGNTCLFGIVLSTAKTEHSVLKVIFRQGTVHGFYYSGDAKNPLTARFHGLKVTRRRALAVLKSPCVLEEGSPAGTLSNAD